MQLLGNPLRSHVFSPLAHPVLFLADLSPMEYSRENVMSTELNFRKKISILVNLFTRSQGALEEMIRHYQILLLLLFLFLPRLLFPLSLPFLLSQPLLFFLVVEEEAGPGE